jgi:SulP family sulfate permease
VKNGGRTPVAGIVHAITLLLITLFFGRLAGLVPFATLAAILVVVAYHMSEWRGFRSEFYAPRSDTTVMLVTFGLTVLVDLTVAIQVGMVLSAFLFMKRMAEVANIDVITAELTDEGADEVDALHARESNVQVFEINGPFFFGAAQMFKERVDAGKDSPPFLLLRMRNVPVIDSTGLHALREVIHRTVKQNKRVLLCDVQPQPLAAMTRALLLQELGEQSVYATYAEALDYVRAVDHDPIRHSRE